MCDSKQEEKLYFVMQALNWTKSVIHQGGRILKNDLYEKTVIDCLHDSPNFFDKLPDRYINSMDEHFFIIALYKSITYLRKVKKIKVLKNDVKEILKKIDSEIGIEDITNIRHMKEHDDEYILGKGNRQDSFITESDDFVADATSTIINQGSHLIGGKINVEKTIEVYRNILSSVELIFEKYMKMDDNI